MTLDAGPGYSSYQWNTGDTTRSITIKSNSLSPGIYTYRVTVSNAAGCEATDSIRIEVKQKTETEIHTLSVKIYPNPASHHLNIVINGAGERIYRLQLYSINGQLLNTYLLENQQENIHLTIDVSGYPAGLYVLSLISEKTTKTCKVLIE